MLNRWTPLPVGQLVRRRPELPVHIGGKHAWAFDQPTVQPRLVVDSVGGSALRVIGRVLAASGDHFVFNCGDPALLVAAHRAPLLRLSVRFSRGVVPGLLGRITLGHAHGTCELVLEGPSQAVRAYKEMLGLHVLECGLATGTPEIEAGGALVPDLTPFFEYRTVETLEQFEEVVQLRTRAYAAAGKHDGAVPMTDEFDQRAVIVVALVFGRIVASLRVMLHGPADKWEHDHFFSWSDALPPREKTAEITRVCVDPAFRRTNVLVGLFPRAGPVILASGRGYFLGSATDKLLPLYQAIGCSPTTIRFRHAELGSAEHVAFVGDIRSSLLGNMNPIAWSILWKELSTLCLESGLIDGLSPSESAKLALLRAVSPLLAGVGRLAQARGRSKRRQEGSK